MSNNDVLPTIPETAILDVLKIKYGLLGNLTELPGYCDLNYLFSGENNEKFIVKIANLHEPTIELEMQTQAMQHLSEQALPVPHVRTNINNDSITTLLVNQQSFKLRVLSYLEGDFYADITPSSITPALWQHLGQFLAKTTLSLANFQHKGAKRYLMWDLAHGFEVCQSKKNLLTSDEQQLVNTVLHDYGQFTLPLLSQLPKGVIHNDANEHNLLVNCRNNATSIVGIIDFGDMVYSHLVNELAIGCAYAMMNQSDPIHVLENIVASYFSIRSLNEAELSVLYSLISLRLCTSICNAAKAIQAEPDNEYLLISVKPAIKLLEQLHQFPALSVLARLRKACGLTPDHGHSINTILQFRDEHCSKTLSTSFNTPLKIVSGKGSYLYDHNGTQYLDMVNNVCHVGHCHPSVVKAAQTQIATLNTNTRFLHDNIVNYSEKLLATFPQQLSVCMLVNSGSEANELAFRLAQAYTKSKELIVLEHAYHGNTGACIDASPYKFNGKGGQGKPEHVHVASIPDPYRGKYNVDVNLEEYINEIEDIVSQIISDGKSIGAFIAESLLGVAGQIILPPHYLKQVYRIIRANNGVCIADEVQVGFGRVGTHMWGFETQQVIPDIVTLGKPIGNGHPMAAVITTQAIADAFNNGMEFFNTFGGNPVSCAIGEAVLDVIGQENLQNHALVTGNYFTQQLAVLAKNNPIIGDVRGLGLFIGVELVTNKVDKTPASAQTSWLIEFFKQHHILLTSEGQYGNIFKIKPPLSLSQQDVDHFIHIFNLGLTTMPNNLG